MYILFGVKKSRNDLFRDFLCDNILVINIKIDFIRLFELKLLTFAPVFKVYFL